MSVTDYRFAAKDAVTRLTKKSRERYNSKSVILKVKAREYAKTVKPEDIDGPIEFGIDVDGKQFITFKVKLKIEKTDESIIAIGVVQQQFSDREDMYISSAMFDICEAAFGVDSYRELDLLIEKGFIIRYTVSKFHPKVELYLE